LPSLIIKFPPIAGNYIQIATEILLTFARKVCQFYYRNDELPPFLTTFNSCLPLAAWKKKEKLLHNYN
jgi:hypothetical protein